MTPNKLSASLVGDERAVTFGKQVRGRLRAWYPREAEAHNTSWSLSDEQVAAVTAWHAAKVEGKAFDFDTFVEEYRDDAKKK